MWYISHLVQVEMFLLFFISECLNLGVYFKYILCLFLHQVGHHHNKSNSLVIVSTGGTLCVCVYVCIYTVLYSFRLTADADTDT